MRSPHLRELPHAAEEKSGWLWTNIPEPFPESMPDGSPWPKISVVTPSFNQGQFIEETIRSVLLQNYPNLEFIIIDGGSTDNTVEVIKKYEPWLFYWVSEPDRGQSHAINKGIFKSSGEILFWLNSDDILLPGSLRIVANVFASHKELPLVSGQAVVIDHEGEEIGELNTYFISWEELITNPGNSIRQIATFFSRNMFEKYGYLNEDLQISMDKELISRFTQQNMPLIINEYLAAFRVHKDSKTAQNLIDGYIETDKLRIKNLTNFDLKKNYLQRSSGNWLHLSQDKFLSYSMRIKCLKEVVLLYPANIFSRKFWHFVCIVVKDFFLGFNRQVK